MKKLESFAILFYIVIGIVIKMSGDDYFKHYPLSIIMTFVIVMFLIIEYFLLMIILFNFVN